MSLALGTCHWDFSWLVLTNLILSHFSWLVLTNLILSPRAGSEVHGGTVLEDAF